MKAFPHTYEVFLEGPAAQRAILRVDGMPDLASAPPREFDGPGDAWSPEHLLLASVQTCLLFTFRAIATASRLDFHSLDVTARGVVDRQERVTRFTEILLQARLVVPPGTDRDRAHQIVEKSERNCLVTASLSTPVRLEIAIEEAM
jgi:uncharacterized OsmC-like protein